MTNWLVYAWPCFEAVGGRCRTVGIVCAFFFGEDCSCVVHMHSALNKILEREGSMSSSSFYGKLEDD